MAVPRLPLQGSGRDGIVSLPHPLDAAAAARIRRIFALQRAGDFPAAATETTKLQDDTLLGDLLADRYLSSGFKPDPAQIRLWLKTFSDLPDAPAIYQLLGSVSPHGAKLGTPPASETLGTESPVAASPEEADPADHAFTRNPLLDRTVRERVAKRAHGAASALRLIAATHPIDPLYATQLRAEVAMGMFTSGDAAGALPVAWAAFESSGRRIGLAGYVAGLAAWRTGRIDMAATLFEGASRATLAAASIRAGAAFWAARAHRELGDVSAYRPWLQRAAATPRTFYGLLAGRALGRSDRPFHAANFDSSLDSQTDAPTGDQMGASNPADAGQPILSEIDVDAVAALPAGKRAFALLQVGETARAEATLRRLWPRLQNDLALCRSVQLVADAAGMTALSAQLADILQIRDGEPRDTARFPMPRLSPHHGFTVNPALVYALTRLESNFDAGAVSDAGAHGLMQLMPVTAGFVIGQPARFTGSPSSLKNPGLNLEIGQRYLTYLSKRSGVNGDLIRLLASYNAGPTAVGRWSDAIAEDNDPLMFVESLPNDETRDYVHRALTYLWIYGERLDTPSPSLDSLAAGQWPHFADEQNLAETLPPTIH